MRRITSLLSLLAFTIPGVACNTTENPNNAHSNTTVIASPTPAATPAESNANVHANMNASEHANMNMGKKNANTNKKP
ncbi:MAG: hypothetical protein ABR501_07020 [Pyrinomonadaceae bacterium]